MIISALLRRVLPSGIEAVPSRRPRSTGCRREARLIQRAYARAHYLLRYRLGAVLNLPRAAHRVRSRPGARRTSMSARRSAIRDRRRPAVASGDHRRQRAAPVGLGLQRREQPARRGRATTSPSTSRPPIRRAPDGGAPTSSATCAASSPPRSTSSSCRTARCGSRRSPSCATCCSPSGSAGAIRTRCSSCGPASRSSPGVRRSGCSSDGCSTSSPGSGRCSPRRAPTPFAERSSSGSSATCSAPTDAASWCTTGTTRPSSAAPTACPRAGHRHRRLRCRPERVPLLRPAGGPADENGDPAVGRPRAVVLVPVRLLVDKGVLRRGRGLQAVSPARA